MQLTDVSFCAGSLSPGSIHSPRRFRFAGDQRSSWRDSRRKTTTAADTGRPRSPGNRTPAHRDCRCDGRAGPQAKRRDGLPAVHQLPLADGIREHRLTPAASRACRTRDPISRSARLAEMLHLTGLLPAPSRRAFRGPAAAGGPGPRARQAGGAHPAGRAAWSTSITSCAKSFETSSRISSGSVERPSFMRDHRSTGSASASAGHTALLAEGRLLQWGPTLKSSAGLATLDAARAFSNSTPQRHPRTSRYESKRSDTRKWGDASA